MEKAAIRIIRNKPNPYSKETRPTVYAEFRIQDLASLSAEFNLSDQPDMWLRLPKGVEPGDTYDILLSPHGRPFVTPGIENSLLPNSQIYVSDDLHVWLIVTVSNNESN
jgi:hypothetical protein